MRAAVALFAALAALATLPLQVIEHPGFEYGGRIFEPAEVALPPIPPHLVRATAYCTCPVCCGKWSDGFTATGTVATEGVTLATDWAVFPRGTCVAIEGVGVRRVEDSGSAIVGDRIDVFMNLHEQALEFGVRFLRIEPWVC